MATTLFTNVRILDGAGALPYAGSVLVDVLQDTPMASWTEGWAGATTPPGTPVAALARSRVRRGRKARS